eukprot:TRINITY_DN64579_c0_g1_i1.p1 TRINITY_DN64579_c0_g1~~TRINITY_DN64579_c0_g1_i1.p1  ORF type:complete len:174 (+),score=48.56 TRINITY_DN64579_c0_g1_i1:262-783(+)
MSACKRRRSMSTVGAQMYFVESFVGGEEEAQGGGHTGVLASLMVFVQSIIGGGLLAYPDAYRQAGVIGMGILQVSLLSLVAVSLGVLGWLTDRTKSDTFQGLVRNILGRRAEVFCEVVMLLLLFGACVVYVDICADQVEPALKLSLIHISEPTRLLSISYAVFCLKKKKRLLE